MTDTSTVAATTSPANPPLVMPAPRRNRAARGGVTAVVVVVALLLPFVLDQFWLSTAVFILVAAIGALGLNVLTGYTGQISLGHAFFLGIGAYTAGVLGGDHGVPAILWIPAAGVAAALCGALIGPTALRLRGLYLAIVTIGVVFIGQYLFLNVNALSGGPEGRSFPAPVFGGLDFSQGTTVAGASIDRNGLYYYLAALILALSMVFVWNLSRTRMGRAFQAVRERELAAGLMGIDLARSKMAAFVLSSFLAGLSGALFGSFLSYAIPAQWSLVLSIQYVAAIIVGGVGTVWGPLLGSVFIFGLQPVMVKYASSLPFLQHQGGGGGVSVSDATAIAYGILTMAFLVLEPRGLIGLALRVRGLVVRRRTAPAAS